MYSPEDRSYHTRCWPLHRWLRGYRNAKVVPHGRTFTLGLCHAFVFLGFDPVLCATRSTSFRVDSRTRLARAWTALSTPSLANTKVPRLTLRILRSRQAAS